MDKKLFLSDAWLYLGQRGSSPTVSCVSNQILVMLLGKRQFKEVRGEDGKKKRVRVDDNRFTLTYAEVTSYGCRRSRNGKGIISPAQMTRAIDELLAKGFIEIVDHGGAYEKHKSKYALVEDYLSWRCGHPPIRVRPKDAHRGYQGTGRGCVKTDSTRVNEGHPHTRQQGTPPPETHASTKDTPEVEELCV